jgi:hypothetical protein
VVSVLPSLSLTLGFYSPYWLYTRIKALNAIPSSAPISVSLPIAVCVLLMASCAIGFLGSVYPGGTGLNVLSMAAQWAFAIVNLVCVFSVRRRLNEDVAAQPGTPYWAGGFATFFLHVLYLNYKLNQRIDAAHTSGVSSSPRMASGPVQA